MIQIFDIIIYIFENYNGIFLTEFTLFCLSFWVIRFVLYGWRMFK